MTCSNKYNIIITLLLLILLAIILYNTYYRYTKDSISYVKSNFDGSHYYVQNNNDNKLITSNNINNVDNNAILAADYLAKITYFINTLVDYMKNNNLPNKEISNRLYTRWKKCLLREVSSSENIVAYTLNKGDEMRICIRHKDKFENINITYFVILHELAHLMSISFDHTDEFRENFNYIVHLASSLGLYFPQDFTREPVYYCGTKINTTPCSNGTCVFNNTIKK